MKSDINDLIKENKELKKNLQEKNEEIENMHNIITSKNLNSSKYMNYIPHHRKYNNYNFGFEQENSLRTEPNIYPEMFVNNCLLFSLLNYRRKPKNSASHS